MAVTYTCAGIREGERLVGYIGKEDMLKAIAAEVERCRICHAEELISALLAEKE